MAPGLTCTGRKITSFGPRSGRRGGCLLAFLWREQDEVAVQRNGSQFDADAAFGDFPGRADLGVVVLVSVLLRDEDFVSGLLASHDNYAFSHC